MATVRTAGVPYAYLWGDEPPPKIGSLDEAHRSRLQRLVGEKGSESLTRPLDHLAMSGGGASGSFAAGLLKGWTATGTRPEFKIVTAVGSEAARELVRGLILACASIPGVFPPVMIEYERGSGISTGFT